MRWHFDAVRRTFSPLRNGTLCLELTFSEYGGASARTAPCAAPSDEVTCPTAWCSTPIDVSFASAQWV